MHRATSVGRLTWNGQQKDDDVGQNVDDAGSDEECRRVDAFARDVDAP